MQGWWKQCQRVDWWLLLWSCDWKCCWRWELWLIARYILTTTYSTLTPIPFESLLFLCTNHTLWDERTVQKAIIAGKESLNKNDEQEIEWGSWPVAVPQSSCCCWFLVFVQYHNCVGMYNIVIVLVLSICLSFWGKRGKRSENAINW